MLVIHTREGHRPDLADCPPAKLARGQLSCGDRRPGPERPHPRSAARTGHDIIDELAPVDGEVVLDKPGKGAFYATDLELLLRNRGITSLIVTGVTTEVCVHTTVREANDRGFECLVLVGLRRLVLPGVPRGRPADDRRPGRDLRLGRAVGRAAAARDARRRHRPHHRPGAS